jgi:hypothetical protein
MDMQISFERASKHKQSIFSKWWFWLLLIIVIIGSIASYQSYLQYNLDKAWKIEGQNVLHPSLSSKEVDIPQNIIENKFGWLGDGNEENTFIGVAGGAWIRPHPGPFLWDSMQTSKDTEISFEATDKLVKSQQNLNYGTLATLWPFAEWDQNSSVDARACEVSNQDKFLPANDKTGHIEYLPLHRCNPADWSKYEVWISAIVERYDGDGKDDMPELEIPIKYWEIMNEPDLQYQNNLQEEETNQLNFYKQGPIEYATLLINTSTIIKKTDPDAKILIAGAAGDDDRMLEFYRKVFANTEATKAFDIGNIHCISNDQETHDFNVTAYKNMLAEFNIILPIWVTEAEAFNKSTANDNFTSTKNSTSSAIHAGAEKIFFTRYSFDDYRTDMSQNDTSNELSENDNINKYLIITSQY